MRSIGNRVQEMDSNGRIEKMRKLRKAAEPLIKFLNDEYHPHVTALVTPTGVEILEGILSVQNINDFIPD